MAEPSDAEVTGPVSPGIETAVYIDASALAKLYVPEAESERLDTFLHGTAVYSNEMRHATAL